MISLIGMGSGCPESLTAQGLAALQSAGLILGAKRLLEHLPAGCTDTVSYTHLTLPTTSRV